MDRACESGLVPSLFAERVLRRSAKRLGTSPGEDQWESKLDHFTEAKKVFEHDDGVLCVGWEELNSFPLSSLIFLGTVCIDELLFQRGFMQPGVEHLLGEFNVVLESIGRFSITEGL